MKTVYKIILILIMTLIMIVGMVGLFGVNKTINEEYLEQDESFYQYFAGEKFEYEGALKLSKDKEITELIFKDDTKVELDSTPIYYQKNKTKNLFATDLAIMYPKANRAMYKIKHFTEIINDNGYFYAKHKNNETLLNKSAFIYDGGDLYYILEDTTLRYGKEVMNLTPMSYVISKYNKGFEVYDFQNDKYITIDTTENIYLETKDYTLNTSLDIIKIGEKEQILLKKIDNLNAIETSD